MERLAKLGVNGEKAQEILRAPVPKGESEPVLKISESNVSSSISLKFISGQSYYNVILGYLVEQCRKRQAVRPIFPLNARFPPSHFSWSLTTTPVQLFEPRNLFRSATCQN